MGHPEALDLDEERISIPDTLFRISPQPEVASSMALGEFVEVVTL